MIDLVCCVGAERWSIAQVSEWLRRLRRPFGDASVSEYVDIFDAFQISGNELVTLSDEDLLDMGVLSREHRRHLLDRISHLITKLQPPSAKSPPPATLVSGRQSLATSHAAHAAHAAPGTGMSVAALPRPHGGASWDLQEQEQEGARKRVQVLSMSNVGMSFLGRSIHDSAQLVNWKEELQNTTVSFNMPKSGRGLDKLPDDELFDEPVGRQLPAAPLPTVDTPFGLFFPALASLLHCCL